MDITTTTHLIIQYRYWILVPLSIIEGPVVAFIAGTLASLHYFNIYALGLIFFLRDMGMDGFYYCLGYFGWKTSFAKRMLGKLHVTEEHLKEVDRKWEEHPARTMFIGKLSYGIAAAFIVAAGMVKMRLRTFFKYGAIVAIAQYGTLLLLGYLWGNALGGSAASVIEHIEYAIAGATILIGGYYILSWSMRRRFLKNEKGVEQ